jgi:membrane protein implicated in regulation of membrane protease activity
MRPSPFAIAHVGLATVATLISVWVASAPPELTAIGVLGGLALGTWAGVADGRRLERRMDRGGGVVLYAEDSVPYLLLWPLGALALSPFAFGTMMRSVARSADVQLVLQVGLCGLTAAWLAHDVSMVRRLRRISARRGSLHVQWFYGRSAVGPESMIGKRGEVTSPCGPTGYVRISGELWRAQSIDGSSLIDGQRVTVRRLNGIVLLVEAAGPVPSDPPLEPPGGARRAG